MEKIDFKDKKITVMGIGLHGGAIAMIKWLLKQGARVTATDMKSKEELAVSLDKLQGLKNLTIVTGQHRLEDFEHAQMVIKNPAVRWDNKYIKAALEKKVPVEMDSSLFFKLCLSKNIIGITGTKGKTTTSTLIYELFKAAGKKVVKVGIGQEAVMNKLTEIDKDTWVVFELSSWRLSALGRAGLSPHVAVVTNIYQDHLNYYETMRGYIADKRKIIEFQKSKDVAVLNWDNDDTRNLLGMSVPLKSTLIYFSTQKIEENKCVYIEDGEIRYNLDGQLGMIISLNDITLRGKHNLSNILGAVAVAVMLKIEPETIRQVVSSYQGSPHRLEFVREISKVQFYNDTAATTPESGIAGINAFEQPLHLICGGSNKNLDLTQFAMEVAQAPQVKKVYFLQGAATEELKKLIEQAGAGARIEGLYTSMDSAVQAAFTVAKQSQADRPDKLPVVLLSPGCASFGMFQNEFDRGDKFKQAVANLSA